MYKEFSENTYGVAKVILTNYFGARVITADDENGNIVKGVFIPLDRNDLRETRNGKVSGYFFLNKTNLPSAENWTHYMQMKVRPDFAIKMKELGYRMPYMGNVKSRNCIKFKKQYQAQLVKTSNYK